ncbi:hypothetical protein SAMN04489798_0180 [Pseudomonas arsenicoxydans]|uniref:Uncharacterized protein n=1 Tax=Pseudomonas arsenicoxydans TaxID=702115 RepID=A0A1H0B1E8_9PSED|nr:hypothetical protein [Pseudomonas arsenicoxydans]SDN39133.1 hypothetical protein SAMN04489798_0180 [Pseudomonas arsenicoxydans]
MASVIEVTRDVIYELSGEKVTISGDSIVQSSLNLAEAPGFNGDGETYATLFTGTTPAGPLVWRVTADYGFTTPVDAVELVECPEGIDIIQSLAVAIVEVDYEDDVC